MFNNVLGVIATVVVLASAVQLAVRSDYWPRSDCSAKAPYTPHDFRCKYYIGR